MTSNHRSKTIICVLLIAITATLSPLWAQTSAPSSLPRSVAPSLPLSRADIQSALDRDGYCRVPPGFTWLDRPIVLRYGMTLEGAGFASQLVAEKGETALEFGESPTTAQPYLYGTYLRDVRFVAGGVRVNKLAQHCGIERVWVDGARGDAFRIEGIGERLTLSDCVAWHAARHGFAIVANGSNNGITLDGCNAQGCGGAGVLLETAGPNAQLNQTLLAGCTIQGNQRGTGLAPADLWIRGYVGETVIRDTWIESPGKLGLRAEPATWPVSVGPFVSLPVTRRVGFLAVEGQTVISECSIAAELLDAYEARLDRLAVHPASAQVRWSLRKPIGAQLMLKPGQLVDAASILPAASQPGGITPVRRP